MVWACLQCKSALCRHDCPHNLWFGRFKIICPSVTHLVLSCNVCGSLQAVRDCRPPTPPSLQAAPPPWLQPRPPPSSWGWWHCRCGLQRRQAARRPPLGRAGGSRPASAASALHGPHQPLLLMGSPASVLGLTLPPHPPCVGHASPSLLLPASLPGRHPHRSHPFPATRPAPQLIFGITIPAVTSAVLNPGGDKCYLNLLSGSVCE